MLGTLLWLSVSSLRIGFRKTVEFQSRRHGHHSKDLVRNHFHMKIGIYWLSVFKKPLMFGTGVVCSQLWSSFNLSAMK